MPVPRISMRARWLTLLAALGGVSCVQDPTKPDPDAALRLPDTSSVEFVEPPVTGRTFWVDPVKGRADGDGSAERPWRTLQEVLEQGRVAYYGLQRSGDTTSPWMLHNPSAPVKGGDRLYLKSGYHGVVRRSQLCFQEWFHLEAAPGDTPVLAQFLITGSFQKLHLKGLRVRKEAWVPPDTATGDQRLWWKADAVNKSAGTLLELRAGWSGALAREAVLQDLDLRSARDVSGWSASDWLERSASGIVLRSARKVTIRGCRLENVRYGISFAPRSDSASAQGNLVRHFTADGIQLASSDTRVEGNRIEGCVKVDDVHNDGIQAWTQGEDGSLGNGVARGNIVRDNVIVGIADSADPFRFSPQGIGAFDGFFEHWVVERNVVVTSNHHGITFYGMRNSRIARNTVIDQVAGDEASPSILVRAHKDGRVSENVRLVANLAMDDISSKGDGMVDSANVEIGANAFARLAWLFLDPFRGDVRLQVNDSTRAFWDGRPKAGASVF